MRITWSALAVGCAFGAVAGFITGILVGMFTRDLWIGVITGACAAGCMLDVLFNGGRCE